MEVREYRDDLFQVELTEGDVNVLYDASRNMEDYGIEVYEGGNLLDKDTLWFFLCELNGVTHYTEPMLNVMNELKELLYPEQ